MRVINNIKALRKAGVEVVECYDRSFPLPVRYHRLFWEHRRIDYDVMVVGWYGHSVLPLARSIAKGPVVLDAFIGLYETEVLDRRNYARNSLKVRLYYLLDKYHFKFADICLVDTNHHGDYFHQEFEVPREKLKTLYVSADEEYYFPRETHKSHERFCILFEGGYTPLHGIQHIIAAAKLLEGRKDIQFVLVGTGQTYNGIRRLAEGLRLRNVTFLPWMSYERLPGVIAKADVCLGIFDVGEKASRVIPSKAIDALAMKKPLITADSPAAREMLEDKVNCLLIPAGDPTALANAILSLKEDKTLANKIAGNGYELFKAQFSLEATGKKLKQILEETLNR